jgi:hypothetical protein
VLWDEKKSSLSWFIRRQKANLILEGEGRMNSFITVMLLTLTMLIVPVVSPGKDIADPLLSANGQAEIPSFGEVVRRNWSSWSQGNETVSKQNLIARIASPEYRGEDAAALVALENYMKKTQTVDLPTAAAIDNDKILDI